MENLSKNLKQLFLSMKERMLLFRLRNSTKSSYSNKSTKNVIRKGASLTINSKTKQTITEVKENVTSIVNKTNCDPNALLDYVKAANTKVFHVENADKFLNLIVEEEGLIYEKAGFEAFYLGLITGQGFKLKTEPMFVLRNAEINKYILLHSFYRWYSLKSDLPGFDYPTQKLFKQYRIDSSDEFTKRLSMEEILALQETIARDQEATAYVLEYSKQVEGSKNVIEKIKTEGNASV